VAVDLGAGACLDSIISLCSPACDCSDSEKYIAAHERFALAERFFHANFQGGDANAQGASADWESKKIRIPPLPPEARTHTIFQRTRTLYTQKETRRPFQGGAHHRYLPAGQCAAKPPACLPLWPKARIQKRCLQLGPAFAAKKRIFGYDGAEAGTEKRARRTHKKIQCDGSGRSD